MHKENQKIIANHKKLKETEERMVLNSPLQNDLKRNEKKTPKLILDENSPKVKINSPFTKRFKRYSKYDKNKGDMLSLNASPKKISKFKAEAEK